MKERLASLARHMAIVSSPFTANRLQLWLLGGDMKCDNFVIKMYALPL